MAEAFYILIGFSDYGGDYRHGCPFTSKTTPDAHIVPPASHLPDLKLPSAPPLRFVHWVPESPYGTPSSRFSKILISPGGLFKRHIVGNNFFWFQ